MEKRNQLAWGRLIADIFMTILVLALAGVIWLGNAHAQGQLAPEDVDWQRIVDENENTQTVESQLLRGIASANLGRLSEALQELEIAGEDAYSDEVAGFILDKLRELRRSPDDILLLNCAAFGSYAFGDLEQSATYFEHIIRLEPDNVWARIFCAIVYGQAGEFDRALHHLERALKLDPENQYTHLLLSAVYKEKQQYLLAIYHYLRAPQAISELKRYGVL
ncbi:MAG: tetratricopeptide repeat protein [Firmicutes bacterium]|jgi:tetratricopeptide (TPR) repeat protein|nr:tetratricopeptide repeat protein [Bacillota bacterium]